MERLALLIGSDFGGLRGVANDLATMRAALGKRGFAPRMCPPAQATRAGILAAYEKLIADTAPGDAVVVYYTGHGSFTTPSGEGAHGPVELQYILPVDYGRSARDDFRGIASVELSVLQARLTAITRNVTVILDCCHSGLISKDPSVTVKAMGPAEYSWVREHIDRLEQRGLPSGLVRSLGNPDAVRVVACAPEQRAYEYQGIAGEWTGVLTESLALALEEAGDEPVTWATVLDRVRHRVVNLGFGQRPEVEGPSHRVLFSTEEADLLHSLPVVSLDVPARVRLDCAALLRVQPGDEFMVMPPGSVCAAETGRIGDLTVDAVSAMSAGGKVAFAPGWSAVPLGARAFPTRVTAPQVVLKVPSGDPRGDLALEALRIAGLARPAEPGEREWAGEVRVAEGGGLELCDRFGPLHPRYHEDPEGIAKLAAAVKVFAQGTLLRRLVGDKSFPLDADVELEWGVVVDGMARPLAVEGETVVEGQHIYVSVRNRGMIPVYLSILDIGISGQISLVYKGSPAGRLLPAGRRLTLGLNEHTQQLTGLELLWPAGLDPARARPETILVLLTSEPQNLLALEMPAIAQKHLGGREAERFRLEGMFGQLGAGVGRDIGADRSSGVRYDIHGIDFALAKRGPGTA